MATARKHDGNYARTHRQHAHPIMEDVKRDAARRKIELLVLPTTKAIEALKENPKETNAILHLLNRPGQRALPGQDTFPHNP